MIRNGDLFDQRAMLADRLLGEHLWAVMQGDEDRAAVARCEANFIDGQLRGLCGLDDTVAP